MAAVPNVGFNSIAELSNFIFAQWQIKFSALINGAGQLANDLTQVVVTKNTEARIPFVDNFKMLDQIGLYANMNYETIVGKFITQKVERFVKGISIGRFDWTEPVAQSILIQQLDALVSLAGWERTRQIARALALGTTNAYPAYDGENLFSNAHQVNGQSFSNLLVDNPLTYDGFRRAKEILQSIPLGEDGTFLPTELAKYYLVVPPFLEVDAAVIVRNTTVYQSGGDGTLNGKIISGTNPYNAMAEIRVSSLLTDPNDWYLIMVLPGLTPFATVQQIDGAPKLIPRIADTDVNVIDRNEYLWTMQLIESTKPVHFYQMVKSVNS